MSPKKISKKELKQDELKIAFVNLVDYYKENQKKINYIVFAAVAVIIVGLLIRVSIVSMNNSAAEYYQTGMENYNKAIQPPPQQNENEPAPQKPEELLRAAKESFQTVVNTYSHSKVYPFAMIMLANSDFLLGNYDEALTGFDTFISKKKKSALAVQAVVGKAYVFEQKAQFEDAIKLLESVMAGPFEYYSKGELYLDLARIYEALKNNPKALEYYRLYEEEYPESRRITQVKEKISALS